MENIAHKYEFIPGRIKQLRKDRGLTLEGLAEFIGKPKQQISLWENGVIKPKIDSLVLLCNYFGVAPDYFFSEVSDTVSDIKEAA